MIENDRELTVTQDRIAFIQGLLAQLQVTTTRDEIPAVASGYQSEVEQTQRDVSNYLSRHTTTPSAIEVEERVLVR